MTDKDCEICQQQEDMLKGTRLMKRAIETSIYSMFDKSEKAFKEERDARAELEAFIAERPHLLVPTVEDSPEESQQKEPPEEANQ